MDNKLKRSLTHLTQRYNRNKQHTVLQLGIIESEEKIRIIIELRKAFFLISDREELSLH